MEKIGLILCSVVLQYFTLFIINILILGSRKIWSLVWLAALTSTIMMGYHSCEPYPDLFGRKIPYKPVKNILCKISECLRPGLFWETVSWNSFLGNVTILYSLKTPENRCFFDVFREYEMGALARNGLSYKKISQNLHA